MASGRIQRWSLLLQSYNFTLRHRSDALSRLPLANDSSGITESTPIPSEWHMIVNFLYSSPVTSEYIHKETNKDPTMSKVFKFCELGWPTSQGHHLGVLGGGEGGGNCPLKTQVPPPHPPSLNLPPTIPQAPRSNSSWFSIIPIEIQVCHHFNITFSYILYDFFFSFFIVCD